MLHSPAVRAACVLVFWGTNSTIAQSAAPPWLEKWAETTQVNGLKASFISTEKGGCIRRGTWSYVLFPTFAQRLEFSEELNGRTLRTLKAVWDSDAGSSVVVARNLHEQSASATIKTQPHSLFGKMSLPSNESFFFLQNRSIKSMLKSGKVHTAPVPYYGSSVRAVFLEDSSNPYLHVFIVNSSSYRTLESRLYVGKSYMFPEFSLSQLRNLEEPELPLPSTFKESTLFVVKSVLRYCTIAGTEIPEAWSVRHCLTIEEEDCLIELQPNSLTVPLSSDVRKSIDLPIGTKVFDAAEGRGYNIGSNGSRSNLELIREEDLDAIIDDPDLSKPLDLQNKRRSEYEETACGPNSLYLALSLIGGNPSLSEISAWCKDRKIEDFRISLKEMVEICADLDVESVAVSGGREMLAKAADYPIILHVRKPKRAHSSSIVDHYLVVDSWDAATQSVRVLDAPREAFRATCEQMCKIWTGKALLIGPEAKEFLRSDRRRTTWLWSLSLSGVMLIGMGSYVLRKVKFRINTNSSAAMLLGIICILMPGCSENYGNSEGKSETPSSHDVQVQGDSEVDLGTVDEPQSGELLNHTFLLKNCGIEIATLVNTRKSCSCLDVQISDRGISPGETVSVTLGMTVDWVVGEKRAAAVLEIAPGDKIITLSMAARAMSATKTLALPMVWELPQSGTPDNYGEEHRKTFTIRQFREKLSQDREIIPDVSVSDARIRIVSVEAWRALGETLYGQARQSRIVLEISGASIARPCDFSCKILLKSTNGNSGVPNKDGVTIGIRG